MNHTTAWHNMHQRHQGYAEVTNHHRLEFIPSHIWIHYSIIAAAIYITELFSLMWKLTPICPYYSVYGIAKQQTGKQTPNSSANSSKSTSPRDAVKRKLYGASQNKTEEPKTPPSEDKDETDDDPLQIRKDVQKRIILVTPAIPVLFGYHLAEIPI